MECQKDRPYPLLIRLLMRSPFNFSNKLGRFIIFPFRFPKEASIHAGRCFSVSAAPRENAVYCKPKTTEMYFPKTNFLLLLLACCWACGEPASAPTTSAEQPNPTNMNMTYDDYPVYVGQDLGLRYRPEASDFRLWAPSAEAVRLQLYETATGGTTLSSHPLEKAPQGLWKLQLPGDQLAKYYTFQVQIAGEWLAEVPDPYAVAVGTNGQRAMVVDLAQTNPPGWEKDQRPPLAHPTDIVLYELHVRDLSLHDNSGIQNQGKFLGLTERGTQNPSGQATGLDHILDLGVTHVHLLPSFDYLSVDESRLDEPQFNWGYDPQNYNIPEGSYSTDPADGRVRIREFKQMVQTLHENGLRVILDVVYNHTGITEGSNFNQLVPGYYYRQDTSGGFSNASACGNETASDRDMMRKFMLESVEYWVREYHIDGFRFDLMGIHDIETMNRISERLAAIDSTIFVYGEGWTAGASPLPAERQALKRNTRHLQSVAAFSDDLRDGLKGSVFEHRERGFVSGQEGRDESIKFGIVAATEHPQIDYPAVNYSDAYWAPQPSQCINYVSCHDNHTLLDRLMISNPEADEAELIRMHTLAQTIVLTSQGVPFLHAGTELLRTKEGEENSYKSPDTINRLDWSRRDRYAGVFDYYRQLIQLRKNHPAFRMRSTPMIQQHLEFLDLAEPQLVGYTIRDHANGDDWSDILVLFNGRAEARKVPIPTGPWTVVLQENAVNEAGLARVTAAELELPRQSAMILMKR